MRITDLSEVAYMQYCKWPLTKGSGTQLIRQDWGHEIWFSCRGISSSSNSGGGAVMVVVVVVLVVVVVVVQIIQFKDSVA